jgi:hypothetical protein
MVVILASTAGLIYIALGGLHALYTFLDIRRPRRIVPSDPAVIAAMKNSTVRLSRGESTMWQAWVGFNFSHSLGAIMLGAGCFIAASCLRVAGPAPWVLFVLAALSAVYLLLAWRYWFRIPLIGTGVATACLAAAGVIHSL